MREMKYVFNKKGEIYLIAMQKDHNPSSNCLLARIVKMVCQESYRNNVLENMENFENCLV